METNFKSHFPNSTACAFQWNYPVINLTRNEFRNCCRTAANRIQNNELDKLGSNIILNSSIERENRARMLLGEKINTCASCWKIEEKNMVSPRSEYFVSQGELTENKTVLSQLSELISHEEKVNLLVQSDLTFSKKINMLEISLSNTCDMKCMYCNHHYSSKWAAEKIKYNEITPENMSIEFPKSNSQFKEHLLKWFKDDGALSVNYINFIGGEPTLINEYYELSLLTGEVLKSISKSHVTISVVTNLNCDYKNFNRFTNHVLELSKYFSFIDINVSIEAYGDKAEYIRQGLNWNRFCQNLEKLLQLPLKNICISAQMATNILSVTSLHQLIELLGTLVHKYKIPIRLRENLVSNPAAHSPMLLTQDFCKYLDLAISKIKKYSNFADSLIIGKSDKEYYTWKTYVLFLENLKSSIQNHKLNQDEKKIIRDFFNKYESRQKTSIYSVFPEYKNFLKSCGVKDYSLGHKLARRFKNRYYISKVINKIFKLNLS